MTDVVPAGKTPAGTFFVVFLLFKMSSGTLNLSK